MAIVENAVYGPVPSWRFGRSLGIDPTLPPKKCSISCVYCQVGPTIHYYDYNSIDESKLKILEPEELRVSLIQYTKDLNPSELDIVIFSGSGEPTLNKKLYKMIDIVREILPNKPVGILSNGTMIEFEQVRQIYQKLDMVTLKLDTADQDLFHKLNHPHKSIPKIDELIENYKKFNENYKGFFGIEVMAMEYKGISNISNSYGDRLIGAIKYISPDVVEIEVPYRPTAKSMVKIPKTSILESFANNLKAFLGKDRVWLYGEYNAMKVTRNIPLHDIENRIVMLLNHRPCTLEDLSNGFGMEKHELGEVLSRLIEDKKITTKYHEEQDFFVPV